MNTAMQPEAQTSLIEGLKQGDPVAFRNAVREYSPTMLVVARFYLDHSSAVDPELAGRFNSTGRWDLPPKLKFHESADTLMEQGALRDCLDKHLSALPESQRSALMLYEAHQHKSEEVCNILDVSASNLRVLLHRARQRIFLMVETFQESGEC